jgi:hypothetical protein
MCRKLEDIVFVIKILRMEKKSNSLAPWGMVCVRKKKGGLGILNLKIQNQRLLLNYYTSFIMRLILLGYIYFGTLVTLGQFLIA